MKEMRTDGHEQEFARSYHVNYSFRVFEDFNHHFFFSFWSGLHIMLA